MAPLTRVKPKFILFILQVYTYMKTAQFLPDITATWSLSRIVLQALKDEWPQRMASR